MITAIAVVTTKPELDDQNAVETYNLYLDRLEKLCHAVVRARAGTVTKLPSAVGLGDAFELHIPVDSVEVLRELVDRANPETKLQIAVGIGHDIHEAKVAAESVMDHEDDGEIKVYHPDMDDSYHEPKDEDSHLPRFKSGDVLVHSEDDEDDLQKKSNPIVEARKVLREIKQNSELYNQIREKNPQAYEAVVETLKALVEAVSAHKEEDARDVDEAKQSQKLLDSHQKKLDQRDVREAKSTAKDVMSQIPVNEQVRSPEHAEFENLAEEPEKLEQGGLDSAILQEMSKDNADRLHEEKSGNLLHDDSIESQDFSYSDDPEFSKALRYVLEHSDLYA